MNARKPLWSPSEQLLAECNLTRFAQANGFQNYDYNELHAWSIEERAQFWNAVWDFTGVIGDRGKSVLQHGDRFPGSQWFADSRLNFAENLLRRTDDNTAIIACGERSETWSLTYAELRVRTAQLSAHLAELGIARGDRVAGILGNVPETIIAMLATSSLGAVWSSCSPDFGADATLDRLGQIQPKLLFACDSYLYNRTDYDITSNVKYVVDNTPSIENTLWLAPSNAELDDFQAIFNRPETEPDFVRLPFNHPLLVMYSSGTTGKPKCIVHGAGGTLLQHLKEHQLQTDVQRDSTMFFFTTAGWMMWNWLVSGLASGARLVLYDGSPFRPNARRLMDLVDEHKINVFGAGAKYYSSIEKAQVRPVETHDMSSLQSILSTGSPLAPESFDYIYNSVKQDVWLASISGGTDIVSCFALGTPWKPVYAGELQASGLGMACDVFDEQGNSVRDEKGELVCTKSFPSAPLGFWADDEHVRYRDAYFNKFPGVWSHGDFAEISSATDGMIIHGRSDAVLNPGGVRIGTAEIYRQVESMDQVTEALCIGQEWDNDVRIIMFVVLAEDTKLDSELNREIKQRIRTNASPRHVPRIIIAVDDIPRTRSGKIAEIAVREVVHGRTVKNVSALANPECLDQFRDLSELSK